MTKELGLFQEDLFSVKANGQWAEPGECLSPEQLFPGQCPAVLRHTVPQMEVFR